MHRRIINTASAEINQCFIRMIGYGSMLMEGLVGVVALVAATSLLPGDYFSINVDRTRTNYVQFVETNSTDSFDLHEQKLEELTQETGEKNLRGRTGGAVTLAVLGVKCSISVETAPASFTASVKALVMTSP